MGSISNKTSRLAGSRSEIYSPHSSTHCYLPPQGEAQRILRMTAKPAEGCHFCALVLGRILDIVQTATDRRHSRSKTAAELPATSHHLHSWEKLVISSWRLTRTQTRSCFNQRFRVTMLRNNTRTT